MRKLTTHATLAALILAGCASQPKFAGRPPSFRGEAAESVWREQLGVTPMRMGSKATVRAARAAKFVGSDFVSRPVKPGHTLAAPMMVQTESNGQVDLFLGDNGPVVRIEKNSTVTIVRLNYERDSPDGPKRVETMLDLVEGRILGSVKPLEPGSVYMIRTAGGVIRIKGTQFEVGADGHTRIVEGEAEVFSAGKRFTVKSGQSYFPNSGLTVGDDI